MPRDKATRPRKRRTTTEETTRTVVTMLRRQDGRRLQPSDVPDLFAPGAPAFVPAVPTPTEADLLAIAFGLPVPSNVVLSAIVELPQGQTSGIAFFETVFDQKQVGAPVIVTHQEPDGDIVLFAGQVISTREMRLVWSCPGGAPALVKVSYILGTAEGVTT
jgi:hypothetical protein